MIKIFYKSMVMAKNIWYNKSNKIVKDGKI